MIFSIINNIEENMISYVESVAFSVEDNLSTQEVDTKVSIRVTLAGTLGSFHVCMDIESDRD
jgi:hypothetical protein